MIYFAYGSNMDRALMRRLCPSAKESGAAVLAGYRFVITADGYASIVRRAGEAVYGVLWRVTERDVAALDAYEGLERGLYRKAWLPVCAAGRAKRFAALVYIARPRGEGRPRPGYLDRVIAAAREWGLPEDYVRSLMRWAPAQSARATGGGTRK